MWLKILKGVVVAARATGLDKKLAGWLRRRLKKAEEKAISVATAKLEAIDAIDALSRNVEGGSE